MFEGSVNTVIILTKQCFETDILFLSVILKDNWCGRLSESLELDELATLPVGVAGRTSLGSEVGTSSVQTSALSASGSQTSHFTVLVSGLGDPVDSRVVTDGTVVGVNHDDLEPLVDGVLANPVRVQNSQ